MLEILSLPSKGLCLSAEIGSTPIERKEPTLQPANISRFPNQHFKLDVGRKKQFVRPDGIWRDTEKSEGRHSRM